MSLALAAKHLESQGRNKDSKLVHMTPDELRALNKLSLDHVGKPLSTNPQTGLPEAGFLSSILPTVAGIAGAAMGFDPMLVAGLVGFGSAALSGDIGQGIMAGLGAWSGGSLGADIKNAGSLVQENAAAVPGAAYNASADFALKGTTEPFSSTLGRSFTTEPTAAFGNQAGIIPTQAAADQMKSFIPQVPNDVSPSTFSNITSQGFPQGTVAPSFSAPLTDMQQSFNNLDLALIMQ